MVAPEDSTSLNGLLKAIIDLDVPPNDPNNLHGKLYELTWNHALGYGKHLEAGGILPRLHPVRYVEGQQQQFSRAQHPRSRLQAGWAANENIRVFVSK